MRNRNIGFGVIGIASLLMACGAEPATVPTETDVSSPDEEEEEDYAPSKTKKPTSAPPWGTSDTPSPALPPAEPTNIDSSDPVAAAYCGEMKTRSPGTFTGDALFEVTGAQKLAAGFDDVKRLSLAFDWPAKRVVDGPAVWRLDARTAIALELLDPNADRTFPVSTTPYAVRVWNYGKNERACTNVPVTNDPTVSGAPFEGTATALITKRTDTEIEGVVSVKDSKGTESKLTFQAPIIPALEHDLTVCCLGSLGGG